MIIFILINCGNFFRHEDLINANGVYADMWQQQLQADDNHDSENTEEVKPKSEEPIVVNRKPHNHP